ncbi:MAG: hypothetical protein IPM74_17030 [Crocinitomicaceae bacterium]|nr:hypothetical protein [Crocinitomicaceae bacterium]
MDSDKYDGMFSISPEKNRTLLDDGVSVQHTRPKNIHPYDFVNENIYDTKGNLITEAKQITYNSEFIIRLSGMYVLDIEPFLNHHYNKTPDKKRFLDYLEFGVIPSEHIKEYGKAAMRSWVNLKRQGVGKLIRLTLCTIGI